MIATEVIGSNWWRRAWIALLVSLVAIVIIAARLQPPPIKITNFYPALQVTRVRITKGANQTYYYPSRLWFYVSRIEERLARWFPVIRPRFAAKSHFQLEDPQGAVCWVTVKQPNGPGMMEYCTFIDSNDVYWGPNLAERKVDLVTFPQALTNTVVFTNIGLLWIPGATISDTKSKTAVAGLWLLPTVTNYAKGYLRVTSTDTKGDYGKSLVQIPDEVYHYHRPVFPRRQEGTGDYSLR